MKRAFQSRDPALGDETLLRFLRVRAWIAHILLAFFFALRWASTDWDHVEESCTVDQAKNYDEKVDTCIPIKFDAAVVMQLKPYLRVSVGILAFISLVLCLVVCKWRHAADYLLIFDLLYLACATLLPQDFYSRTDYSIFVNQSIFFLLFYTQHKAQIIVQTLMHFLGSIIVPGVIYQQENTVENLAEKIGLVLTGLFLNLLIATSLLYISSLHSKLKGINS